MALALALGAWSVGWLKARPWLSRFRGAFDAAGGLLLIAPGLYRSTYASFPYRGLPELNYPLHEREVLVTACGRICMHRKRINVSTVLAGQKLGVKEVDEGIWIVSFMHYDLGYVDLEQKTLQPLDNPFGPRLLPMS